MFEMTSIFPKDLSEVTDEHTRSSLNEDELSKNGPKTESDAEKKNRGDGRDGCQWLRANRRQWHDNAAPKRCIVGAWMCACI